MTLTNLVFWLRLAILVSYLLEQIDRKSVGNLPLAHSPSFDLGFDLKGQV